MLEDAFDWSGAPARRPRPAPVALEGDDPLAQAWQRVQAEGDPSLRVTSPAVAALVAAVDQVLADLPEGQALADAAVLIKIICLKDGRRLNENGGVD